MLSNILPFIKCIEESGRDSYGQSVIVKRKYNKTANPSAETISFYDASKKKSEPAYTYNTEEIPITAIVRWVTKEEIEDTPIGEYQIGDGMVEMPIIRESLMKDAVREKFEITIDEETYYAVESTPNRLRTKVNILCRKGLPE